MGHASIVLASELFKKRTPRRVSHQIAERQARGLRVRYMEEIWGLVRKWAEANGKEYDSTYGVVGVAPT
jgi:hypothetical protein